MRVALRDNWTCLPWCIFPTGFSCSGNRSYNGNKRTME